MRNIHGQMSCGPRMSPRLLMSIPCDMSKSSYCSLPGSSYPWSSVRRYIYENQGLVKRMYGDQRHSFVLSNEIEDAREKYDSIYFYNNRGYFQDHPYIKPRSAFKSNDNDEEDFSPIPENSFEKILTSSEKSNAEQVSSSPFSTPSTTSTLPISPVASLFLPTAARLNPNETSPNTETENKATSTATAFTDSTDSTNTPSMYADFDLTTLLEENFSSQSPPTSSSSTSSSSTTASTVTTTTTTTTTSTTTTTPAPTTEGFKTEPIVKKGVNACPVKEEVIAPYWANNTRGEILALLNVYPFEQYIHWEKCSFENSQMFCRDGCRCEQQYRLHRLLAFDPKNECKGIFADWFRFPSCCVCICYDLPDTNVFYRVNKRKSRL